jgi:ACS family hexuronate transporter-like MFS transporter
VAIALISAAGFVCFVWFINTATLVSDVFDEGVVGSVQGLIGSAGSAGGVLFNMLTGFVVSHFGYSPIFALAASLHVLAALVIWGFMRDTSSTISSRIGMATASNVSF